MAEIHAGNDQIKHIIASDVALEVEKAIVRAVYLLLGRRKWEMTTIPFLPLNFIKITCM